jgi:ribonuclease HII
MVDPEERLPSIVSCEDAAAFEDSVRIQHDSVASCDANILARNSFVNVHDNGPIFLSAIPEVCRSSEDGVLVGIDEAGRGSVLGPLVYGLAFWSVRDEPSIPKQFKDSKQLSEDLRTSLMDVIVGNPAIGFAARIIHASEVSRNMLRVRPYNLNQMSFDAVFEMIRSLIALGVKIRTCYIDTIGNPVHYQQRLRNTFGTGIEFIVESKCDANYAPCSAASVGRIRLQSCELLVPPNSCLR